VFYKAAQKEVSKHKFFAKPATREWADGSVIHFASTKEARYFDQLQLAEKGGHLLFFLRQVPFHLPGGVTYRLDYLEFWSTGEVRCVDVKGRKTKQYIDKKKQVEALYPVKIIEA